MRKTLRHEDDRTFFNFGNLPLALPVTKRDEVRDVATTMRTTLGNRTIVAACNPPKRLADVRAVEQNPADFFNITGRDERLARKRDLYRHI
jgi:hypothetical protein